GAVSRPVGHLEGLGLLSRTCDPADRRAQILVATTSGRERVERLRAERRGVVAGRLADWSVADLAALAHHLGRYNAALEIHPDEE
ncbi:MAG: MarR family winged helix-turn-helix transcriptional regulator, partial [Nocardioidaceae bacterium]